MTCTECKKNYCTGVSEIASYLLWKSIFFKDSTTNGTAVAPRFRWWLNFWKILIFKGDMTLFLRLRRSHSKYRQLGTSHFWRLSYLSDSGGDTAIYSTAHHEILIFKGDMTLFLRHPYSIFSYTLYICLISYDLNLITITIWMNCFIGSVHYLSSPLPRQNWGGPRNFTKTPLFRVEIYLDPPF